MKSTASSNKDSEQSDQSGIVTNETRGSITAGNVSEVFALFADGKIKPSANERKIADLILEDVDLVTGASITELAELVRCFQTLSARILRRIKETPIRILDDDHRQLLRD